MEAKSPIMVSWSIITTTTTTGMKRRIDGAADRRSNGDGCVPATDRVRAESRRPNQANFPPCRELSYSDRCFALGPMFSFLMSTLS